MYLQELKSIINPSFEAVRNLAVKNVNRHSQAERKLAFDELNRGVALLDSELKLNVYLRSFGLMHQAKLLDAFRKLPIDVLRNPFEVYDWGCGQGIGTMVLFDYIKSKGLDNNVNGVTLIEPSKTALDRAEKHVEIFLKKGVQKKGINKFFEDISIKELKSSNECTSTIHIFSNILDVEQIDLKKLSKLIDNSICNNSYIICVGPLNPTNKRIDAFSKYFKADPIYAYETYHLNETNWTYKCKIFKLETKPDGNLIPIEYYPTVQFQAAYELDAVRVLRKVQNVRYSDQLSHFETAAPFDLGACVYDNVHPILAVLNNIITRGLPTKCSEYIETHFSKCFGLTNRIIENGEIVFKANIEFDTKELDQVFYKYLDADKQVSEEDLDSLEFLLTPIAVARFKKMLVEALLTGHLPMEKETWKIIVIEEDVPFAALAIEDFKQIFENLTKLSEDYRGLKLPEIDLSIVSNQSFYKSKLHLDANVYLKVNNELKDQVYDLVVTQAILKSVSKSIESFSAFKCNNNCYFNIRTIQNQKSSRSVYTTSLIKYRDIVIKNEKEEYSEIEETVSYLKYFLRLLFRKEDFRPGQLPILGRALKNLPVIGLLPTGGGKSLTYQIAGLLQPGISMVIDPLKSLMIDQYEGLLKNGIDSCTFINSTLSAEEKRNRELQLESSQLLFVFLSPERLAIQSFRRRLKNMHEYNVYFSYGVLDEVHCVSEWGHDFRFSYLHLGRNLYNYVRAKDGEISLFGLTATASFDVLADVERELSGNGAFNLDSDTIVRYENTNRLELQYKVEKIDIRFEEDEYYDSYNKMPKHLPKALNLSKTKSIYFSKTKDLSSYVKEINKHILELNDPENILKIKKSFLDRQGSDSKEFEDDIFKRDLSTDFPNDFYKPNSKYKDAGIVFCPHVNGTGLSVNVNVDKLRAALNPNIGSFSGKDNDDEALKNLELFRENDVPIMVATKAFGMGIDKPNVRFTFNLNYSSSLEAFVQEAGRAGRDRKMALATILFSDYSLARVRKTYEKNNYPINIIKNKWFYKKDLALIFDHFKIDVPEEFVDYATPSDDIMKLHCSTDNRMFMFNQCSSECVNYKGCQLRLVNSESKGWKTRSELLSEIRNLNISSKSFQYLNPDYQTVMYFFGESFKGDIIEKKVMLNLLNTIPIEVISEDNSSSATIMNGFLEPLLNSEVGENIIVLVPYDEDSIADLSKAIYRMCCIELIIDFTQDYSARKFRIIVARKTPGEYFEGLKNFLLRYYIAERAEIELEKAKNKAINGSFSEIITEIYKCLAYLTEFVYDKISEKRKRAIDDMRNFCLEGIDQSKSWIERNEELKDFIFYYFNSKFAKPGFIADNGEAFSLLDDTEQGKRSDVHTLFKFLRITDDEIVGNGTPLDNVKHLFGATRLISRSLTDTNPTINLLEAFCIAHLGFRTNENLKKQLIERYSAGMIDYAGRFEDRKDFWELFHDFSNHLVGLLTEEELTILKEETTVLINAKDIKNITYKYISYE